MSQLDDEKLVEVKIIGLVILTRLRLRLGYIGMGLNFESKVRFSAAWLLDLGLTWILCMGLFFFILNYTTETQRCIFYILSHDS